MGTDPFKTDTDGDGLDGANPDSDGDGIKDGDDPFITPSGCADTDTKVSHAYNSCIGGKFHTLTAHYYIRRCQNLPDQVIHIIEQDVPTDEPCNQPITPPPALSDVQ